MTEINALLARRYRKLAKDTMRQVRRMRADARRPGNRHAAALRTMVAEGRIDAKRYRMKARRHARG